MNRRSFLLAAGGSALGVGLGGCQRAQSEGLRLAMVANSLPNQLLGMFQQGRSAGVAVTPQPSLASLYGLLQGWQKPPADKGSAPAADWVSLADYWLAPAIRQGLIQPVEAGALEHWPELAAVWPELVRRDRQGVPAASGSPWAVPYRWSHLVLLYDPSRLPGTAPLATWADLLNPALTRRVILPEHPRLVLGLAQRALRASANGDNPAAVSGFTDFLAQLHGQVRTYDSEHYLEALVVGDAAAVVAWSDDALPLLRQYRHLAVAVPPEGTLLSAQLWVRPASAPAPSSLAMDWLNFCLGADFATQLAIFGQGTSPRLWGVEPDQLPEPLGRSPQLGLSPAVARRSEFLLPLETAAAARYADLWQQLRTPKA